MIQQIGAVTSRPMPQRIAPMKLITNATTTITRKTDAEVVLHEVEARGQRFAAAHALVEDVEAVERQHERGDDARDDAEDQPDADDEAVEDRAR